MTKTELVLDVGMVKRQFGPPPTKYPAIHNHAVQPLKGSIGIPPTKFPGATVLRKMASSSLVLQPMKPVPKWSFGKGSGVGGGDVPATSFYGPPRSTVFGLSIGPDDHLNITKNNKSKTFGDEHAEEVALRLLQDDVNISGDNIGLGKPHKYTPGGSAIAPLNQWILTVSASPCSSTARTCAIPTTTKIGRLGCAELLIDLKVNGLQDKAGRTYYFAVTVIYGGVYRGKSTVVEGNAAIVAMHAAGIDMRDDSANKKIY